MPHKATNDLQHLLPNKKVKSLLAGHKSSYIFKRIVGRWVINFIEKDQPQEIWEKSNKREEVLESNR
jgi:predicted transcriptional regulator